MCSWERENQRPPRVVVCLRLAVSDYVGALEVLPAYSVVVDGMRPLDAKGRALKDPEGSLQALNPEKYRCFASRILG